MADKTEFTDSDLHIVSKREAALIKLKEVQEQSIENNEIDTLARKAIIKMAEDEISKITKDLNSFVDR